MRDDDYSPFRTPADRPPIRGEELWTFIRGTERQRAELRDHGAFGAELQLYVNDEFTSGQRYETRALAALAAEAIRDAYEGAGWRCSQCAGERWLCEAHPAKPAGHDGCSEAGEPCSACNTSDPPRPPRGFVSLVK